MAISNIFTEPGVYSQFRPQAVLPVLPGGVRVTALVGPGRTTNLVSGEEVTKGAEDAADNLAHVATSLAATIQDEDFNTYHLTDDYVLTGGDVAWTPAAVAFIVGTEDETFNMSTVKTLKLTVSGGIEQSHDISEVGNPGAYPVPGMATAAQVVAVINSLFTGVTAVVSGGTKVRLETVADNNADLLIGDGTANLELGFTDGSLVATPREPAPGKKYFVDYEYAKASADYTPRFFFNMNDVIAEHGEVSTTNKLSLGAEIVFQQGTSVVCLVQIDPADGSTVNQFRKAIDKLLPVTGINIVVPLVTDTSLQSYLKTHCETASSLLERKERTGIMGLSGSPSIATIIGYAQGLASKRIVIVYPTSATRFVGTNTTVDTLDGSFIAAAIAGVRTSNAFDVAEPLTRKEITGFESVPDTLLRTQKNQLSSEGILVIDTIGATPRVRFQTTTDPSTIVNREYSVVETIDFVSQTTRDLLEPIFIGQKILEDTPSQVRSAIVSILQDLVDKEILVAFTDVQASVNNSDPTQIDVSFRISPVYPLNYILITFSI
jgi:hypothetical protein